MRPGWYGEYQHKEKAEQQLILGCRVRFYHLVFVVFLSSGLSQAADWQPYPEHLPAFEFLGSQLFENWERLTGGSRGPFPDAASIAADAHRWPALAAYTDDAMKERAAEDESLALYADGVLSNHYDDYAQRLQQVWRLFFEGRYREARDEGIALGPAGYFPGLYAQAIYATLVETDPVRRQALLEEIVTLTEDILPLAPDHTMIRFGQAYGKARILENLSRSAALGTGYTGDVKKQLEQLLEENPENIYALTLLAGVHAGIMEKAGRLMARVTFGSRPELMEDYFQRALAINDSYPGLYYEYARAQLRVYGKDGKARARELLEKAVQLTPVSAEEALQLEACRHLLGTL